MTVVIFMCYYCTMFNKDPSHLPLSRRNQYTIGFQTVHQRCICRCPAGCIVLFLYLSMSSSAWNKLEKNFLSYVNSLVNDTNDAFWRNRRFLVYTDRKMASHKDGAIRLCKSWRDLTIPELISVSPLAIVAGQETSLLLRGRNLTGRNLTAPSTTIHCTHADGRYSIEKVASSCQATGHDHEIILSSFMICESAIIEENGQISISIKDGMKPFQVEMNDDQGPKSSSCPRCAVTAARLYSTRFSSGLLHHRWMRASASSVAVLASC
ncbi:SBP domain [Castilleja foliolosa]|uniref:SBP domain n=1 Tax=Castilleja foliolosa TaxID=1961234 RepID=A0ABD3BN60_9LAMI